MSTLQHQCGHIATTPSCKYANCLFMSSATTVVAAAHASPFWMCSLHAALLKCGRRSQQRITISLSCLIFSVAIKQLDALSSVLLSLLLLIRSTNVGGQCFQQGGWHCAHGSPRGAPSAYLHALHVQGDGSGH